MIWSLSTIGIDIGTSGAKGVLLTAEGASAPGAERGAIRC